MVAFKDAHKNAVPLRAPAPAPTTSQPADGGSWASASTSSPPNDAYSGLASSFAALTTDSSLSSNPPPQSSRNRAPAEDPPLSRRAKAGTGAPSIPIPALLDTYFCNIAELKVPEDAPVRRHLALLATVQQSLFYPLYSFEMFFPLEPADTQCWIVRCLVLAVVDGSYRNLRRTISWRFYWAASQNLPHFTRYNTDLDPQAGFCHTCCFAACLEKRKQMSMVVHKIRIDKIMEFKPLARLG